MTDRRQIAILAGLSIGSLTCFGWLLFCVHRTDCLNALSQMDSWASTGTGVVLPSAVAGVALWLGILGWRLVRTGLQVAALAESGERPPALIAAMQRTGARRVRCLAADGPTAFCAGALRPQIVVSMGLLTQMSADETDAVLLHEHEHARTFEPLVRAALESASEVFFFVPVLRWWCRRRLENSELRADRVALDRLGPRPVASALLLMGGTAVLGTAAFAGVTELRVAQVLGDRLPNRAPASPPLAMSILGSLLALQVVSCFVQALQHLG